MGRARLGLVAALGVAASAGIADAQTACELRWIVQRNQAPSRSCLACHDGSAGPGLGISHPVDVDYHRAAWSQRGRYVPASALPPEVPLVNGKIGCTTCHDGRSQRPSHVAEIADLCSACHQL